MLQSYPKIVPLDKKRRKIIERNPEHNRQIRKQNAPNSESMIYEKSRKFAAFLGSNNFKATSGFLISFREHHVIFSKKKISALDNDATTCKQQEKMKIKNIILMMCTT